MTIEQVEEVDFIGIDENENIVLTISDQEKVSKKIKLTASQKILREHD